MRIGVDILERARFEPVVAKERWTRALFTARELEPVSGYHPERAVEYLGGRFCAKEAVAKVLGTGFLTGVRWRDVEVLRSAATGEPSVTLHRGARERAADLGIVEVLVSISHQPGVLVAFAVGRP